MVGEQIILNNKKKRPKGKNEYKKKILQDKINKYTHLFNKQVNETNYTEQNTNSWFDVKIYKQNSNLFGKLNINYDSLSNDGYFTKSYEIFPTNNQQIILKEWLRCYTLMYNVTIEYICTEWFKFKQNNKIKKIKKVKRNKKLIIINMKKKKNNGTFNLNINNFKKQLSEEKKKIIIKSEIMDGSKTIAVDSHLLDYAINDAMNRYKSCLTNIQRRNINHFRLRNLKINRNNQVLKLEKLAFKEFGFSVAKLGNIMKIDCDNFNYKKNIHTVATLHYVKKTNTFKLLVKYEKSKKELIKIPNNTISLDPGIRKGFTGYAPKEIVEIGTTIYPKLSEIFKRIDNINNNITKKSNHHGPVKVPKSNEKIIKVKKINPIKKELSKELSKELKIKLLKKLREKVKNIVNDFHWKTIDYLTKTYTSILIGNFSTKSMGESDNVNNMVKRVGNALRFFEFKERLKYRCVYTNTKYSHIDEAYTSKCCCKCGTYDKNLGSKKVYKCINQLCNQIIGRDINGAINILIKSLP